MDINEICDLLESKKAEIVKKNEIEKNNAKKNAEMLKGNKITIYKEIMENGNLYGSITIKEICNELQKSSKVNIKPEQIELSSNIKSKGEYKFKVNLHADVQSEVLIEVIAKE